MDILRYCHRLSHPMTSTSVSNTTEIEHELPSWVPNFGIDIKGPSFILGSNINDFDRIPWPSISSQLHRECSNGQLKLYSLQLDLISNLDLGKEMNAMLETGYDIVEVRRHGYLSLAASQGSKYFNGEDFHEAYWRTLSTDRFYDLRGPKQYVERLRTHNLTFWREGLKILESEVESASSGNS